MVDIQILRQRCGIHTKQQARLLIDRYIVKDIQEIYHLEDRLRKVFGRQE